MTPPPSGKFLSVEQHRELLSILRTRFESYPNRHEGIQWNTIQEKLESSPEKLWSLNQMESTGGEPDVVACDADRDHFIFYDCSAESPKGRRSLCYDNKALEERKEFRPGDSAEGMAVSMGIEILTETQYRELQKLGKFDTKTSSWLRTPEEIRDLGGAIFGDRRYDHVFVYHNGAQSYYSGRGFRGYLSV